MACSMPTRSLCRIFVASTVTTMASSASKAEAIHPSRLITCTALPYFFFGGRGRFLTDVIPFECFTKAAGETEGCQPL